MQILIDSLQVSYATNDSGTVQALGPLSLAITTGSFVTVIGPSGSGKSTLLRAVGGLVKPDSGTIRLDDVPVDGPNAHIAMMFQAATLMPWRTVRQNIALPLELGGAAADEYTQVAHELLQPLGLGEFGDAYPHELSGGMAQRVALGRVLVQNPAVMLLDEPFGALDALTREKISMDLLSLWQARMSTVLMVTHDIQEAVLLSDRVIVLSSRPGKIVRDLTVKLPRPRTLDMTYTPEFLSMVKDLRAAIDTQDW